MENILPKKSITNILDKLEDEVKFEKVCKKLIDFRYHAITDWINRMDKKEFSSRKEYTDKTDRDVDNCAKEILEVANCAKEIMEVVNNDSKG